MSSPLLTLAWEIWQRRRRSGYVVLACISVSALANVLLHENLKLTSGDEGNFSPFFGILMVLSFLFLMGIFNYTEYSSTREWSGFPLRLFLLPVPTWQLVALPMVLGLVTVEAVYFAWIKLVWTHGQIVTPEWWAVVLGAYLVFFQTTLWSLAAFRVTRVIALAIGGISSFLVACLPFMNQVFLWQWATEGLFIKLLVGLTFMSFAIAWITVARQRSGGGRRQNWLKVLTGRIIDAMPRRTKDFASPAAAQFWYEWRHAGWLLPACTTFVIVFIFVPITWFDRDSAQDTIDNLWRLLATPVVLAFIVGKAFIKPEFWSTSLSLPLFTAVKPLPKGEFVVSKLKVAALSAALAWIPVLVFLALWPLWANTSQVEQEMYFFCMKYPHSWLAIFVLAIFGLIVLTWRCMIGGLWAGLSGRGVFYYGIPALQLIAVLLIWLACAIWFNEIDKVCQERSDLAARAVLSVISWGLAVLVVCKYWLAVFSWSKISARRTKQYLLIWACVTLALLSLAILADPPFDMYRQVYIYLLVALWMVPFARLGLAPAAFARNRHR